MDKDDQAQVAVPCRSVRLGVFGRHPIRGPSDMFLAKYDATGTRLWVRIIGGRNFDRALGVAVAGDALYLVGLTSGRGLVEGIDARGGDAVIAKFSPAGIARWI